MGRRLKYQNRDEVVARMRQPGASSIGVLSEVMVWRDQALSGLETADSPQGLVPREQVTDLEKELAIKKGASQVSCCDLLSLSERRLQRWRIEPDDKRVGGYRAHDQRLSASEQEAAVALIQKAQEAQKPLRCVYAEELDAGRYTCSPASLYRIRNRLIPINARPPLMMKRSRRRSGAQSAHTYEAQIKFGFFPPSPLNYVFDCVPDLFQSLFHLLGTDSDF
jgi:hypothetical protein